MKLTLFTFFFVFASTGAYANVCDRLQREVLLNTNAIQCAMQEAEDDGGITLPPDYPAAAHAQRERTYLTELFGRSGCNNKQLAEAVLNQSNRRINCPKRGE